MTNEIMKSYQSSSMGGNHPDFACMSEGIFYTLLKYMGVSLEWARKNCNITIEDGMAWITPVTEEDQSGKTNKHLGIH